LSTMNSRATRRRWSRFLLGVSLVTLLVGCGSPEPPPPPVAGGDAAGVPPAEMRTILEGLRSNQARTQYAALETLDRFPTVVAAHRDQIEQLKTAGKDDRVRKKAAELLASLPVQNPP